VKAPGFGDRRKEMLQDIAIVTGADFVSEDVGKKLTAADVSSLGQAHRVVSTKDSTVIVGGKGDKTEIEKRIHQIKNQLEKSDSEFDKEKLKERLGKLAGGVAVIRVGAPTESAQKELKQRVEDAVSATRAAMEEGVIPGGGVALFNVHLKQAEGGKELTTPIAQAAAAIMNRALLSPLTAIAVNSGESADRVVEDMCDRKEKGKEMWTGFNAVNNKIGDLKSAGIIDPLKVTKVAFLNALSVAANYLTIGAAITDIPKKDEKMPPMGGAGGDY